MMVIFAGWANSQQQAVIEYLQAGCRGGLEFAGQSRSAIARSSPDCDGS
jgi:hypothetical protein